MNQKLNIKINKQKIRIISGIIILFVLSISFSGISIKTGIAKSVLCSISSYDNPAVSLLTSEYNNTGEMFGALIMDNYLPMSEVIGNAAMLNSDSIMIGASNTVVGDRTYSLYDKVIYENEETNTGNDPYNELTENVMAENNHSNAASVPAISVNAIDSGSLISKLIETNSTSFLLKNFYIVDSTTSIKKNNFKVKRMLEKDFSIDKSPEPQILIYHTHGASESFKGSDENNPEEGVVGVGTYLTEVLQNTYGYNVYHDTTCYDLIDGKIDRSLAYAKALPSIKDILAKYPSIKVIIDLHRDGVGSNVQTVTNIGGVQTAQVMLFNGLSRNSRGDIKYLHNDNLQDNLAFSLQLKLEAMKHYPGLTKPIYLKGYRYNLHLLPRSLLIELGSENNTLEEARNAIPPLADVLNRVLMGTEKM